MATPKYVTAGVSAWSEAVANRALMSDGAKVQVKVYHAHIRYNGADFIVDSTDDSAGIVTGDLTFDITADELRITLAGFTNLPIAMVSPHNVNTAYEVKAGANSATRMDVRFYNIDTGAHILTNEDTNMDFNIIIIGF